MVTNIYQVFGSHDSVDCDIIVFVTTIGSVADSRALIDKLKQELQPLFDKEVNINLAVLTDGRVTEVFKGTPDEVNNSLLTTYDLHKQAHPQQIKHRVSRDAGLKALRAMRAVISFASRTQYRPAIKVALAGTAIEKHRILREMQFGAISDLGNKNTTMNDFYKTLAFQMGQSFLLNHDIEVYTKGDIARHLPQLKTFLSRDGGDATILDQFKELWLDSFIPANIPEFEILRR
jgi:hypothetical protein